MVICSHAFSRAWDRLHVSVSKQLSIKIALIVFDDCKANNWELSEIKASFNKMTISSLFIYFHQQRNNYKQSIKWSS